MNHHAAAMRSFTVTGITLLSLLIVAPLYADSPGVDLQPILQSEIRSNESRGRDGYRHPAQTLSFFEVEPDQVVVEIWPGGKGWYTEILAPLLREQGKLYCAHWSQTSQIQYFSKSRQDFDSKMAKYPQVYDRVVVTLLEPMAETTVAPAGAADRVLTFRNVHNWLKAGTADTVFDAMFAALKPGGLLGVVEHRARPGTTEQEMITSGYVTEQRVRQLAEKAGFQWVGDSDINANPKDSTDHPKGVWSLPPSLRGGEQGREQYLAIGESDRMTVKFRKPD